MQFAKFDYLSVFISFVEQVCRTRFDSTESLRDSVRFRSHVPEIRARNTLSKLSTRCVISFTNNNFTEDQKG